MNWLHTEAQKVPDMPQIAGELFKIKKTPGRASRTQRCSELFLCQVLNPPSVKS